MWHLQQLLRTKLEVAEAKMPRVRVPFEILPPSLNVTRTSGAGDDPQATMRLSLKIKTNTKCVLQVFWGVKTDALEKSYRMASAKSLSGALSPSSASSKRSIPVLQRLSVSRAAELPTFLSRVRRQSRRHRLNDDKVSDGSGDGYESCVKLEHIVGEESFRSASPPER